MASVFVDILRDIRGQGDLDSINASPGVAANAGLPASFTDGGIYQRIKDKEAHVSEMTGSVEGISTNIYGTDPVNGSNGSIWRDIILRSNQVSADASQVARDKSETARLAGNAYEAEAAMMTAKSYATEPENVEVKEYISNGDGTYQCNIQSGVYSSLHWNAKAQLIGDARMEHYYQELAPVATQRGATWFKESTGVMSIWTNVDGIDKWVNISNGGSYDVVESSQIAINGQTIFQLDYSTNNFMQVYMNGIKLEQYKYDAVTGDCVVLHNEANDGDIISFVEICKQNINETSQTATDNQTDFAIPYLLSSTIQVYANGVRLTQDKYIANSGTNIILNSERNEGDIITFIEIPAADAIGCTNGGVVPPVSGPAGIEHYNQETAPSPDASGATWYQPSTNKTFKYVNDGVADFWTDISFNPTTMDGYIGHIEKTKIIATDNQTVLNVIYDLSEMDLFLHINGLLIDEAEYDSTSGTNLVLSYPLNDGDVAVIDTFKRTPAPVGAISVVSFQETLYEPVAIGTDTFAVTYDAVDLIEVYRNGFKLAPSNYTAVSGTDVVLNTPTSSPNETIEIIVLKTKADAVGEDCNLIINGNFASNSRGAKNKLDTSNDPAGEYSYDMWTVVAGVLQQRIEDGRYTPNSTYTLSGDNIITQQIVSPASGTWTVDTGSADPDNVVLNFGSTIKNCPTTPEYEIQRAKKYYNKIKFKYKGYANGRVTQHSYVGVKMIPGATVMQECIWHGGITDPSDGQYLEYEMSENEDYVYMFLKEYLSPGAYDFDIDLIFDASL